MVVVISGEGIDRLVYSYLILGEGDFSVAGTEDVGF